MAEDGIFNFRRVLKTDERTLSDGDDFQSFDLRLAGMLKEASLDPLKVGGDAWDGADAEAGLVTDYVPGDEFWF